MFMFIVRSDVFSEERSFLRQDNLNISRILYIKISSTYIFITKPLNFYPSMLLKF